jgi:hypothetical protein
MRPSILTFLTPGFLLIGLLTVSCKHGITPSISSPVGVSEDAEIAPIDEPPDIDDPYVILSARDYDPDACTWGWDSLDFSQDAIIVPQDGGIIHLRVDFVPYHGVHTAHDIVFSVPQDALDEEATLRICTPDPGFTMFSLSIAGDWKETDPYQLQQPAHVSFSMDGIDLSGIAIMDVNLLRWSVEDMNWTTASGYVNIQGETLTGTFNTKELTRYAIGILRE